jgi:hypothetical protein
MAKSSTRRVTIYINGKEVESFGKQMRSETNEKEKNNIEKICTFVPIKLLLCHEV